MKPPCRLAHSVITGSSHRLGARPNSLARTRPMVQTIIIGMARICGLASRWLAVRMTDSVANISAWTGSKERSKARVSSATLNANASAVRATTAVHDPRACALAINTSDSHSCAVHGAPRIV